MNNRHHLSENSRHWNQVCLSLLPIATATLGATFLVSGLGTPDKGPITHFDLVKIAAAGTATLAYGLLTFAAIRTIIGRRDIPLQQAEEWKHAETSKVLSWLLVITIFLGVTIFATIYSPERIFPATTESPPANQAPTTACPETLSINPPPIYPGPYRPAPPAG